MNELSTISDLKISAKINKHKKNYIFLHNNYCKKPYIEIYIDLLSVNFNLLSVLLHYAHQRLPDQWFWNLYCDSNNIIAKYIVLSSIISVVSDNILLRCIQESLLILKKIIVLHHTLSAYNSLLFRYKVYFPDPRECLYKSWRYAEAYENLSIDPTPWWKNPILI